jgi:sugar phosphate isomerase/epimerase
MRASRREFCRMPLLAVPLGLALCGPRQLFAQTPAAAKPNSVWGGVQVGLNVPYSFGTRTGQNAEEVLTHCVALGISGVELRAQAIEISMGLPTALVLGAAPSDYRAVFETGSGLPEAPGTVNTSNSLTNRVWTPDELKTYAQGAKSVRSWRMAAPLDKLPAIRKRYEDAGVKIDIVKFDGINDMEDAELDYAFTLAKTLGARAVSAELWSPSVPRIAKAADRHKTWVGLHNHLTETPAILEQAFAYGEYVGANVDIGHYVAGNHTSPLPFIEKHHKRITHLHVKDKTFDNRLTEFGAGDTPIKQILQALRDQRWSQIPAIIEYEIPLPPNADRDAELRRAIAYCRSCLLS